MPMWREHLINLELCVGVRLKTEHLIGNLQ
jgi:hypothetical protein